MQKAELKRQNKQQKTPDSALALWQPDCLLWDGGGGGTSEKQRSGASAPSWAFDLRCGGGG